jgi:nucleoside-diphosphate kinase
MPFFFNFAALSRERAEEFYIEHRNKFFYNRLVSFMSSGVCHFHILMREDAIKTWRTLMGPTKVFKTRYESPDTIRGRFGLTDTRNCSHGSDSEETAQKEIAFFFPEFDQKSFDATERSLFVQNKCFLDRIQFVHRPTS